MTTFTEQIVDALRKHIDTHRLVGSGHLTLLQIAEARANNLFFVDPETAFGFALVPWDCWTLPELARETLAPEEHADES